MRRLRRRHEQLVVRVALLRYLFIPVNIRVIAIPPVFTLCSPLRSVVVDRTAVVVVVMALRSESIVFLFFVTFRSFPVISSWSEPNVTGHPLAPQLPG